LSTMTLLENIQTIMLILSIMRLLKNIQIIMLILSTMNENKTLASLIWQLDDYVQRFILEVETQ
uniref:hypothetical protein n=1 Tax=Flectobacillus sp. TaxID=50419 RepID=UPI003B9B72D2